MKAFSDQRGMTLVTMLVAIVIVGILAGIIFSNLASARRHARDAALQQTMSQLYRESLVDKDFANGTIDPCNPPVGSRVERFVEEIERLGTVDTDCKRHQISNTVYQWRISIAGNTLDTDAGERYCVDSGGFVGIIDAGKDGNIPASQRLCIDIKPGGGKK